MEAWLNNFINLIPIGGLYYTIIGLLVFVDSLAFIGILYPGGLLIIFTGFLAANGKGDLFSLACVSAIGSIAGDIISYVIGARAGGAIMKRPWFKRRENLLQKAQIYFAGHGGKSVFIGRFVGFLRPFIPFIAGSARMNPYAFAMYALVSGILWGIITPGLGYICGASWQMVQVWSGRFSLLFLLLATLFLLNALFWRYLLPVLMRIIQSGAVKISAYWLEFVSGPSVQAFKLRHPKVWIFLCRRFTTKHATGICLTSGLIVSTLFAALFAWIGRNIQFSNKLTHIDQRVYELSAILHHPWTDLFFSVITWFGSTQAMFIFGALTLFILIINNRDFSALVIIFGMAGGELFAALAKVLFARPRPTPLFPNLNIVGASFPSVHAFSALLFYGLIVYFLIDTTRNWRGARIALLLAGSFIILLIGFSRIYLGVHWISDVLAGFTLAALWLTFLITLCETRFRYGGFGLKQGCRPFKFALRSQFLLMISAGLIAAVMVFISITPYIRTISLGRATPSSQIMPIETLRENLPITTENLWGSPHRPLNLIVIADESTLRSRLSAAMWRPATQVGITGFKNLFLHLVQGGDKTEATIIPQLVEGQRQHFSFVRNGTEIDLPPLRSLLVWDLGRRLPDGRTAWGLLACQEIGVKHLSIFPLPLPLIAPVGTDEVSELVTLLSQQGDKDQIIIILPEQGTILQ